LSSVPSIAESRSWVIHAADRRGAVVIGFLRQQLEIFQMVYVSMRTAIFHERQGFRSIFSVVLAQIYYTGWQALPLVSGLALAIGGVVILNASALTFLADIKIISKLLVVVVVRELGPLVIALILIARSGTAIAAEIGGMKVNREIDALKSMAINPLSFIVFPRIVGGIISLVCLTFCFNLVALLGGFAVSRIFHDLPFSLYSETLADTLSIADVGLFLSKNILNGVMIFSIACYEGLKVVESPHEVPQATTRAVMSSIAAVGVTTSLATFAFYLPQLVGLLWT
jgi:phospholipid/cholesterol/gamma-HCH transport system permease protein